MTPTSRLFELIIVKSWWVIILLLATLMLFDVGMQKKEQELSRLKSKRAHLQEELLLAETRRERLQQEIASRDDQEWMEMVLMRNLGLIPRGETKIVVR